MSHFKNGDHVITPLGSGKVNGKEYDGKGNVMRILVKFDEPNYWTKMTNLDIAAFWVHEVSKKDAP